MASGNRDRCSRTWAIINVALLSRRRWGGYYNTAALVLNTIYHFCLDTICVFTEKYKNR